MHVPRQVAEASQREGLAAAQREADLERMQSQAACEAAACAEAAGEKLRGRLQASQKEVQSLKERLSSLLAERKQQQCVQQLQACQLWFLKIVTVCSASLAGQLATLNTNRIINLFACSWKQLLPLMQLARCCPLAFCSWPPMHATLAT